MEKPENRKSSTALIAELTGDLQNSSTARDWFTQYWFSWISCFSFIAILTYVAAAFFPNDIHLPQNLKSASFWSENAMWLFLSVTSAMVGYLSAQPVRSSRLFLRMAYAISLLLIVGLLTRESPSSMADAFGAEMHWHRGPCGFFILATGIISAFWMSFILRRAAPTSLSFTGLWVAVSIGSLGSMFMHLVCTHESTAHEILWHISPLLLLAILGASLSPKVLRW
jgi:hypothetical protein